MKERKMSKFVTALFKSRVAVDAAMNALSNRGYTRNEVTVLASDATRTKEFVLEVGRRTASGAGIGGTIGVVIGATAAAFMAIGTAITIPWLGFVVAGPIVASLAGAGAGGVLGGLVGGIIGSRIPEHRAKVCDAKLNRGGILLGVETGSKEAAKEVQKLFMDLGAVNTRKT